MTTPPVKPPEQGPALELSPNLEPVYSNMVRISHSPLEIVMDFARMLPGQPLPKVQARLLMSPVGAKLFYRALGENLARFESSFGEIILPGDPNLANELFGTVHPSGKPPEK
jgi:hypothetical protein